MPIQIQIIAEQPLSKVPQGICYLLSDTQTLVEDKATIISSPKVIATSGKTATIERGDTFYLSPAENVEAQEVEAKLRLEVIPVAMPNNYVNLTKLKLEDERQVSSTIHE